MDEKKVPQQADGRQIEEAIALFEGILQSSPEDQVALEALSLAYEQTGNLPLARATLLRHAGVVIRQQALEAVPELIRRLKPYAENDFDALEALRSLETMAMAAPDGAVPDGATVPGQPQQEKELRSGVSLRRQVLRREMELAWKLLEANELTQDEYAQLVDDLSRLIANERQAIISLLHVLTDRSFPGLERILRYVSKASKTPFIALGSFEVQKVDLGSVPLEYLLQQGVLPFETMGNELLVALLNPLNAEIRREIGTLLGRRCHFYLVTAEAFDAAIAKLMPPAKPEEPAAPGT